MSREQRTAFELDLVVTAAARHTSSKMGWTVKGIGTPSRSIIPKTCRDAGLRDRLFQDVVLDCFTGYLLNNSPAKGGVELSALHSNGVTGYFEEGCLQRRRPEAVKPPGRLAATVKLGGDEFARTGCVPFQLAC